MAHLAGLTALLLLAGCGGERDGAPPSGEAAVATADTAMTSAAPAPTAGDTAGDSAAGATGAPTRDTAAVPERASPEPASRPSEPAEKPAPKPAPTPAPKPAPTPAPQPAPAAEDTAREPAQEAAQPQESVTAAQDTPQTDQQTADAPLRDAYHQAPRDTVDQATYDGWKQYNLNCARCHGEDVLGSTIAPHLVMSLKPNGPIPTQEAFMEVVCAGRPEKGMPAWCALGMEPATISQIYSYVKGRSEGKLGPGRPARREGS